MIGSLHVASATAAFSILEHAKTSNSATSTGSRRVVFLVNLIRYFDVLKETDGCKLRLSILVERS